MTIKSEIENISDHSYSSFWKTSKSLTFLAFKVVLSYKTPTIVEITATHWFMTAQNC